MRVVIVDAFERGNRGDAALLSVAVAQVREAFPGAQISIAGFEDPAEHPTFDGVENIGSIRRYVGEEKVGRPSRVLRKLAAAGIAAVASLPRPRSLLRGIARRLPGDLRAELLALVDADLVLALGGGYLNAKADFASDLSIGLLLLPMWIAERCGRPVVLAPQSYGPFPRPQQRAMVRRVLGASRQVVARESISVTRLREAGVPLRNVTRGVDSAFAFRGASNRPWRRELGIGPDERVVLMTARSYLPAEPQAAYERAMAAAVRHLTGRHGCRVVLVPQVTCDFQNDDDRIVNARIAALADDPALIVLDDGRIDHHDIFALYATSDVIVGTRFHSVIFGLGAGVPCLAVEYDHKTRGIMQDLSLGQWVIRMADVRDEVLNPLIDQLVAGQSDYRRHLAAVLPGYAGRAAEFVATLQASIEPVRAPVASALSHGRA